MYLFKIFNQEITIKIKRITLSLQQQHAKISSI